VGQALSGAAVKFGGTEELSGCARFGTDNADIVSSVSGRSVITEGLSENTSSRVSALSVLDRERSSNSASVPLTTVSGAFGEIGKLLECARVDTDSANVLYSVSGLSVLTCALPENFLIHLPITVPSRVGQSDRLSFFLAEGR
jgi:hypothetical protein